jgi:hypothetical protein
VGVGLCCPVLKPERLNQTVKMVVNDAVYMLCSVCDVWFESGGRYSIHCVGDGDRVAHGIPLSSPFRIIASHPPPPNHILLCPCW